MNKLFSLTQRWDRNRYYHSVSETQKMQAWSFTIRCISLSYPKHSAELQSIILNQEVQKECSYLHLCVVFSLFLLCRFVCFLMFFPDSIEYECFMGVMAKKKYTAFLRSSELEPYHQIHRVLERR